MHTYTNTSQNIFPATHTTTGDTIVVPSENNVEDPFVMGSTLLVLAAVELVIGLGLYKFFC